MKKPRNDKLRPDWRVYLGNRQERECWDLPEPPPWRPRRALPESVPADEKRPPLAAATINNGRTYQVDDDAIQMVNAAIHLRRPLLVTGSPGSGKSTLVDSIAYELGLGEPLRWGVTSRSTLRDALYSYDAIGRVQHQQQDAVNTQLVTIGNFIELGPLGTAMLPSHRPRILLIDEIDKADFDLPSDLLNILDEGRFHIPELSRLGRQDIEVQGFGGNGKVRITDGRVESYEFPLVILTSNGERDFPAPFLRRCLQLRMPDPFANRERLTAIVAAHLGASMAERSSDLITEFIDRAQRGELLATDHLLNAAQLVMGAYAMNDDDRASLRNRLQTGLGRKS
ncbi:AAA family ATPase [Burkholderia cepacia]|uniref:AAA family ATPase n=1 Tax=Burkholderia cepacia TaxID=292 RepID=UPI00069FBC7E|nr:MoxR family ATPase [Burkholderia cepacia]